VAQGIIGTFRTTWARDLGAMLDRLVPFGPMLLLALLSMGWFLNINVLGSILGPARDAILRLILGW
jgi:hypothetical protein